MLKSYSQLFCPPDDLTVMYSSVNVTSDTEIIKMKLAQAFSVTATNRIFCLKWNIRKKSDMSNAWSSIKS